MSELVGADNPTNSLELTNIHATASKQTSSPSNNLGITVTFENVSIIEKVPPPEDAGIQTLISPFIALGKVIASGFKGAPDQEFARIKNVSGVIHPGTMTLILGSPGSGKSSLLRVLSTYTAPTSGTITYNGIPTDKMAQKYDIDPRRVAQYMTQTDVHLPTLSVEDTIQFAYDCANINSVGDDALCPSKTDAKYASKVEQVIDMLHLNNCRHTNVGDHSIRGVSGGEAKRVSIAEILMSNAKLLCLDQFSDGLDAYVAQHITQQLKGWTRSTGGSVVATLQQPTTGIFDLFDDIILLHEGNIIYHGPSSQIIKFLDDAGHPIPNDADPGDFIISVLSEPLFTSGIYIPAFTPDEQKPKKKRKYFSRPSVSHKSYSVIAGTEGPYEDGGIDPGDIEYDSDDDSDLDDSTPNKDHTASASASATTQQQSSHQSAPRQICLTSEDFLVFYQQSEQYMHHQTHIERVKSIQVTDLFANNPFTTPVTTQRDKTDGDLDDYITLDTYKALYAYSSKYSSFQSTIRLFWLLTSRQFMVTLVIKDMTLVPIIISIFMGIFLGTTSYQLEATSSTIANFNSIACLTATQFSFFNFPALQGAIDQSRVAIRQYSNRFYNSPMFIAATTVASIPVTIAQTIIFVTMIYWLCGFNAEAASFIYTLLFMILSSIQLNILFRFLAFIEPLGEAGKAFAGSLNGVGIVFSGVFVTASNIPVYLREFYYALPFSWTARSMLLIEFLSDKYTSVPVGDSNLGHIYLRFLDIEPDALWVLYSVLYHVGTSILLYVATIWLLSRRYSFEGIQRGTKRHDDEELEQFIAKYHDSNTPQPTPNPSQNDQLVSTHGNGGSDGHSPNNSSNNSNTHRGVTFAPGTGIVIEAKEDLQTLSSVLRFRPYTLSFENLSYTVPVVIDGKKQDKVLLSNINGVIAPGKLTALMGSSGAGKTTCLDVLAFRKTNGVVKGTIRLNDQIATKELTTKVTGYVEQFEAIFGYSTVYETLIFVANLKMSKDISNETKKKIIEEILDVLEISQIRHMIVGNAIIPGISVSELKRLGVAIQLLSNPSILFLDEPTTGLDSHDALVVMRVIKRISRTRCVVLTIHQPSSELFFLCDRLILLAQGKQIYTGDIGPRARDVVQYFHNNCGDIIEPLPHRYNPSTWLLELTHHQKKPSASESGDDQGTTETGGKVDVAQVLIERYANSQLCEKNILAVRHIANRDAPQSSQDEQRTKDNQHTKHNICYQFYYLLQRNFMASWRNIYLIGSRFMTIFLLAVILGLIYKDVSPTDQASASTAIASKIIVPCFTAILSGGAVILIDSTIIPTLQREKFNNLYPSPLWGLVGFVLEILWCLIDSILMSVSYFIVSGNRLDDAQYFFMFFLSTYMTCLFLSAISHLISTTVKSYQAVQMVQGMLVSIFISLSGVAIPGLPAFYRGLTYISPLFYAAKTLVMPQFEDYEGEMAIADDVQGSIMVPVREYVSSYLGWDYYTFSENILYLLAFVVGIEVIVAIVIRFVNLQEK